MTESPSNSSSARHSGLSARQLTQVSLEQLRRDAKRLKRANQLTHAEALDQVARRHGFGNWSLLAQSCALAAAEMRAEAGARDEDVLDDGAPFDQVQFNATRAETLLMAKIVDRFRAITEDTFDASKLELMMDLEACHCNGCPLDLAALLGAERDADVVHDVAGINRYLNRETGQLEELFRPRYADNRPSRLP